MLTFSPPLKFEPGTVTGLLRDGYERIKPQVPEEVWEKLTMTFAEFDQEIISNPNVARCTFITELEGIPIGLGSYDPRMRPAYGLVGHNVIHPSAQGKKYGKIQLLEILERMRAMGIRIARATTGDHPFFVSAQKNYESVGFKETRRFVDKKWSFGQIEYEMKLEH